MLVNDQLSVVKEVQPSQGERTWASVCVCVCVDDWVHCYVCFPCAFCCVCVCVCVCGVALVESFGYFLDFVCACVCNVIKAEVPPSHLTAEEREVENFKEEEQIQLLLEADGRSGPWKYVDKYL